MAGRCVLFNSINRCLLYLKITLQHNTENRGEDTIKTIHESTFLPLWREIDTAGSHLSNPAHVLAAVNRPFVGAGNCVPNQSGLNWIIFLRSKSKLDLWPESYYFSPSEQKKSPAESIHNIECFVCWVTWMLGNDTNACTNTQRTKLFCLPTKKTLLAKKAFRFGHYTRFSSSFFILAPRDFIKSSLMAYRSRWSNVYCEEKGAFKVSVQRGEFFATVG